MVFVKAMMMEMMLLMMMMMMTIIVSSLPMGLISNLGVRAYGVVKV